MLTFGWQLLSAFILYWWVMTSFQLWLLPLIHWSSLDSPFPCISFSFHQKGQDWIYLVPFGACIGLFFHVNVHSKVNNTLYCLFNRTIKYLTMAWGQMVMTQHVEIQDWWCIKCWNKLFQHMVSFASFWTRMGIYIHMCLYKKLVDEWVRVDWSICT